MDHLTESYSLLAMTLKSRNVMPHFECKSWVGVSPRIRFSISFLRSHGRAFSLVKSGSVVAWWNAHKEIKMKKYHLVAVEPKTVSGIILFSISSSTREPIVRCCAGLEHDLLHSPISKIIVCIIYQSKTNCACCINFFTNYKPIFIHWYTNVIRKNL